MDGLSELLEYAVSPNRLPDTTWLRRFLDARCQGYEPIMLGLGETWGSTPAPLVRRLTAAPASAHGYQLSMYGLPRLRSVLRDYLIDTHRLAGYEDAIEVAVSWTGTRSVMRDFGQMIAADGGPLTAVAIAPAWDYAGVLEPSGFAMHYMDPTRYGEWLPTPRLVEEFAATLTDPIGLVIINAQHNPTGLHWPAETVRALVRLAADHSAAVLIDDAYYGFLDPAEEPTSAVRELLLEAGATRLKWLAVRSLGKQFNCNGWALGGILGPPRLLDDLVNEMRAAHTYNHAAVLQSAMADWLADHTAVADYLAAERCEYGRRRRSAIDALVENGVPADDIVTGPAAPYLLYPVPSAQWAADRLGYLERCAVQAGVFMSDVWPAARLMLPHDGRHVRMFLGRTPEMINEACERLACCGLLIPEDD